jgi:hypothetical protein
MEVVFGVACLIGAVVLIDVAWARWALIGVGLLGLSPWPGAGAILRKADHNPDVLIADPDRRRARGRRAVMFIVPLYTFVGFAVGYVIDGWPAAIFVGLIVAASAGLGAWFFLRWAKT